MNQYSVLMSVYYKDKPKWLKEAIQSMLNQTAKTNDFVIVKDGPLTEELDKVLNIFTSQFPNLFNIIELEKNKGLGIALRTGIQECKNELVARMDADDFSMPTRCERQLQKFKEDKELSIVGTRVAEFEENIEEIRTYRELPETNQEIYNYIKKRNPFAHPSVMFKKSKVIEAGNYMNYYLCEDYELWVRMVNEGNKCYNIKDNLVYMRVNDSFYRRRGRIKFLKSILRLKKEYYKKGFFAKKDYIYTIIGYIIICLVPNKVRKYFYKNILRKKIK